MTDYNFIKRCKNYNIKKSKGLKYETIVRRSMKKIKKLDVEMNIRYCYHNYILDRMNRIKNDYINDKINPN